MCVYLLNPIPFFTTTLRLPWRRNESRYRSSRARSLWRDPRFFVFKLGPWSLTTRRSSPAIPRPRPLSFVNHRGGEGEETQEDNYTLRSAFPRTCPCFALPFCNGFAFISTSHSHAARRFANETGSSPVHRERLGSSQRSCRSPLSPLRIFHFIFPSLFSNPSEVIFKWLNVELESNACIGYFTRARSAVSPIFLFISSKILYFYE